MESNETKTSPTSTVCAVSTPTETAVLPNPVVRINSYDREPYRSGQSTPRSERDVNPFDTDMEAMVTSSSMDKCPRASIVLTRKNDCQVWPGKDHWKQRAKAAKKSQRSCTCMSRFNRRTRIAVKVAVVLLVVGLAVAIGFGVSKPLGAPIWGNNKRR
ncbi:hypothetical protein DCS_02015 [Drechmeria coniospora]|uniref:Uncharacterized protein n=1 Tax=Drechmeria coniospora TaxID=98403 RepID=A0A151GUU7_DRECN|nr:hypothetical protein DCS_02015 [Drechmeria coniospora]KYK60877.1 hypothetical protein DCS_02015 [Drechmeria coniospora]